MVTGLIYTEVNSTGNHRNDEFRVKRSLARGARLVRRMRVRNSSNPKTAYANKPGHSLLLSIQQMEGQIHALQKKTADYEEALKAECEARKEATEALMKEVTVLRPLKGTAVNIRERFFATYCRKKDALRIEDPFIIDSGNLRAQAGDVILDVCLFQNHLISFEETFSDLYGMSWRQAEHLLGFEKLVDAMNTRATGMTNPHLGWSFEQEAEFRHLVNTTICT